MGSQVVNTGLWEFGAKVDGERSAMSDVFITHRGQPPADADQCQPLPQRIQVGGPPSD